jgi:rhodanese-related sulfurtransferase
MSPFADAEHELEPADADRLVREEGWTLVDVREPHELEEGRIAGSRHIELTELTAQAESIDRERPVVFYCHVGSRSGMATEAFRAAGYEAYNVTGGIEAWAAAGLPVER